MSKLQRVYRVIRQHLSREDARYAAPRLIELHAQFAKEPAA